MHTQNRLFDTLDPTTRLFSPDGKHDALLTDTVGFIKNLPTHLVDAFRATLEELSFADLVLVVIDASDPNRDQKLNVTEELAAELCAEGTPRLYVFNKADICPFDSIPARSPDTLSISAVTGENIDRLLVKIADKLDKDKVSFNILLPYNDAGALDLLHREADVESVEYVENGISVIGKCVKSLAGRLKKYEKPQT